MKIIAIFLKNIKQLKRDRKDLFLILILPIIVMIAYSTLFSGNLIDFETVNLGVIDLDDGGYSNDLLNRISDFSLDNHTKLYNLVQLENEDEASEMIKNEQISAIIIVPSNYSSSIADNNLNTDITIKGDPTSPGYITAISTLNVIFIDYANEIQQNITNQPIKHINLVSEELKGMDMFNTFDYLAPGLIVFSILMNITAVSSNISQETENGMLKRLKLTKMKSKDYIFGTSLSWIIIGSIEIIAVLITAIVFGYHWLGGLPSILLAIIVGILTMISTIALSLIVVSLTKNSSQASSLGLIISFPLSIISGSFFPLPEFYIGTINGHHTQIYELLPWSQTITIFREILTFGKDIGSVLPNIFLIIVSGLVLLFISVILFNRKINNTN